MINCFYGSKFCWQRPFYKTAHCRNQILSFKGVNQVGKPFDKLITWPSHLMHLTTMQTRLSILSPGVRLIQLFLSPFQAHQPSSIDGVLFFVNWDLVPFPWIEPIDTSLSENQRENRGNFGERKKMAHIFWGLSLHLVLCICYLTLHILHCQTIRGTGSRLHLLLRYIDTPRSQACWEKVQKYRKLWKNQEKLQK